MHITRSQIAALATVALTLALAAAPAVAQSAHVVVPPDKVQWGPAPPVLPAGAEIAVLEGDPGAKGPVTLRLRFPANYDIPAHWHSMDERVTVLSGSFHIGMGDKLDRGAGQRLQPGGFVSLPANMRHFAWSTSPTVVQINLEGPFDIFYVNPADNPATRQSKK
jgi:quercetin dioxygenase-like cupin family protein